MAKLGELGNFLRIEPACLWLSSETRTENNQLNQNLEQEEFNLFSWVYRLARLG